MKIIKASLITIFIVLFIAGVTVGALLLARPADGFSEDDYQNAIEAGKNAAEAYRAELEDLILDLMERIENATDDNDLTDLNNKFSELVDDIEKQLEEQGGQVGEVNAAYLESLRGMRESLGALKEVYAGEVAGFEKQLAEIEDAISDLKELGEDFSSELAAFEVLKKITESELKARRENVGKLDAQIKELDRMIEDLLQ